MNATSGVSSTIRRLRELKEVTREHMASELEMSLSGYSKIERGETDLTLSKLQKIAEVLEVDIARILNFDPSNVFNISNNNVVQGVGSEKVVNHNSGGNSHTDKYIALLEAEVARLKKLLGEG